MADTDGETYTVRIRTKYNPDVYIDNSYTLSTPPPSVGGSVSGGTTVCTGNNTTPLTLSGQVGTIQKWQSSPDGSTWTDIAHTSATLTVTDLTETALYRALVQSGVCAPAYSETATVTVEPASTGGTLDGSLTICTGSDVVLAFLMAHQPQPGFLVLRDFTGSVVRWESSVDEAFTHPVDLGNSNRLLVENLTQTTYFRAVVQSAECPGAFSSVATVTIDPASVGGTVSGSATVCTGSNSTTLNLNGQVGTIVKWQSSPDGGSSWTDISNTEITHTATNLTQTTHYRAVVRSGACAEAFSESATLTVDPASAGGTVSGSTTVCTGSNSTTLNLSGQVGSLIKWQSSPDGSSWTDIANTNTTLTATNLTQTTHFRAVVGSGACAEAFSESATLTVDPASVGGTVSGSTTVCTGSNSMTLNLNGQVGAVSSRWQSSTDGGNSWTDISNTEITHTATNLTQTTRYRAMVRSGACAEAFSESATLTVDPASAGGTVSGSTTVCTGSNSTR